MLQRIYSLLWVVTAKLIVRFILNGMPSSVLQYIHVSSLSQERNTWGNALFYFKLMVPCIMIQC